MKRYLGRGGSSDNARAPRPRCVIEREVRAVTRAGSSAAASSAAGPGDPRSGTESPVSLVQRLAGNDTAGHLKG